MASRGFQPMLKVAMRAAAPKDCETFLGPGKMKEFAIFPDLSIQALFHLFQQRLFVQVVPGDVHDEGVQLESVHTFGYADGRVFQHDYKNYFMQLNKYLILSAFNLFQFFHTLM